MAAIEKSLQTEPAVSAQPEPHARTQAISLLAVLVIGIAGGFLGGAIQDRTDNGASASLSNQKKIVTSQSQLVSSIAKKVGPSVVSVNVSVTSQAAADSLSRYFGYDQPPQEQQAAGTGIIISSNLILTNRHVVPAGTSKVSVTLSDGTELTDVTVVGRTNDSDSLDIAILKVGDTKGKKLVAASLGDSTQTAVGDQVVAIGNALGEFQNTVTTGIISGYARSITAGSSSDDSESENLDNLFQTDAAINEGNSGGPLVNLNGQVIGVNTAVASDSQSIGFAIPIGDVQGLIKHVIATGKFERPYLGIRYVLLTADIAKQYSLSVTNGAYIVPSEGGTSSVVSGGAADKAGLKAGDVITKVGGTAVDTTHSLTSLLGRSQPGDTVRLTVVNGKATRTVEAVLGTAPAA